MQHVVQKLGNSTCDNERNLGGMKWQVSSSGGSCQAGMQALHRAQQLAAAQA